MNKQAGCLAKQIHQCLSRLHSFTDGQVHMVRMDWDAMQELVLDVQPNAGPFVGGRFRFTIGFQESYPNTRPTLSCETPIFHPNIDSESDSDNICVSLLSDWTASNTLEDVVLAVLYLMHQPNLDDPLVEYNSETFEENTNRIYRDKAKPVDDEGEEMDATLEWDLAVKWDLSAEEYDVLGEAAKAEWLYKLEQENIQAEMKRWEMEQEKNEREKAEKEEKKRQLEEEEQRRIQSEKDKEEHDQEMPVDGDQTALVGELAKTESVVLDLNQPCKINCSVSKHRLQKCHTMFERDLGRDTNSWCAMRSRNFSRPEGTLDKDCLSCAASSGHVVRREEEEMDCEDDAAKGGACAAVAHDARLTDSDIKMERCTYSLTSDQNSHDKTQISLRRGLTCTF